MSDPAPQRFGRFALLQLLGGSMGLVYRARAADGDQDVALKVLRHERLLDGEARARFLREVQVLASLQHPHLCPLLEAGEVDGIPYYCMPLLSGRSLASRLAADGSGATPDWRQAATHMAVVADALHAAHQAGVVHRDIKPSNILLDPHDQPMVIDFGLARTHADRYRQLTRSGQVVGTPEYMAPEQIEPRLGPSDARTDVYACGVVLYELLTGQRPFARTSRRHLFERILTGPPPDLRGLTRTVPLALVTVLDTAMARRARHRYPSAAALAADLRCVLAGTAITARRPAPWQRWWRHACARPRRVATAAGLLGAGLALVVAAATAADAAGAIHAHGTRIEAASWLGRLETARQALAALPPPRPRHVPALHAWLRDFGAPLLAATPDGEASAPGLHAFATRVVAEVELKIALAQRLEQQSLVAQSGAWTQAAAAVSADRRFAGFVLRPQCGLVPLGADSKSGLQEFYDLTSGDPDLPLPTRDAADPAHRLVLAERHGIVFVLVPGGRFTPTGHPGETVTLAPFLLAKHEMTRAQWTRLDPDPDPSCRPLGPLPDSQELQTLRHPVDRVRFNACLALLPRFGLALPTEMQWEYAARECGVRTYGTTTAGNFGGGGDGYVFSAPVGSFPANALGLHDMEGNLVEWVLDAFASTDKPARAGDGLRDLAPEDPQRTACGGDHLWRSFLPRRPTLADQRWDQQGVRPVWTWDPP